MAKLELLEKYAKLIVEVGANVQKDQILVVRSSTDTAELARLIVKAGYNAGAKMVKVQWNDAYVYDEVLYQKGMLNRDISRFLESHDIRENITADSAEPKSIEEIRRAGKNIKGVTKGADSIMFGISTMQGQEYLVTKQSTNVINELRYYCWDTDKNGKKLNRPIDLWNHSIDAIRYHEMESIGINNSMFMF